MHSVLYYAEVILNLYLSVPSNLSVFQGRVTPKEQWEMGKRRKKMNIKEEE